MSQYLLITVQCPMAGEVTIFIDLSQLPMDGDVTIFIDLWDGEVTIFIDLSPLPYGW